MFNLADVQRYIYEYQPEGIIIDTNILILLLVGKCNPSYIDTCGLLNNSNKVYTINEFKLLDELLTYFKKVVITPQVIAELSNLSLKSRMHGDELTQYFQVVINFLKKAEERHQEISCLWGVNIKVIQRFGFTDLTLFELSKQSKMPILTDELDLYIHASTSTPVIKFEHLMQSYQGLLHN